ncbi:phosphocholine cytidylyltransferase family protein [Candidatus Kaiserbacteria bacterium]|nr:phosphocholine cytidylyltransferase family protein [Candidatus Kaiserbacteria bacterium]
MKALILAAGEAKRLKPITENMPKCMLQVGEKRIIDYQVRSLIDSGVSDIVVVTGFLAEKLENHLSSTHKDAIFTFIRSKDYYKTYPAHGMWLAKEHLNGDVIYLNADVICHPNLIKEVVTTKYDSATALHKNEWDEEQVNIIVRPDTDEVLSMGKQVSAKLSSGEFVGVTKLGTEFNKELVKVLDSFIEKDELKKFAADAINLTIQRGQAMYALDLSHLAAIEIDTPDDLIEADIKLKQFYNE